MVLVDHQVGLLSDVRDIPVGDLKHNVVALARAATVLGIPLVVTTTAAEGLWGPTTPELVEALADNAAPDSGAVYAALDMPFAGAALSLSRRGAVCFGPRRATWTSRAAMTAAPIHMDCCQPSTKDCWAAWIRSWAWLPVSGATSMALAMPSRALSAAPSGMPSSLSSMALR